LDDEYVSQFGRGFVGKVIAYGLDPRAQVRAANVKSLGADGSQFDVIVDGTSQSVHLPLVGSHNVYNALAAIAAGIDRGISLAEAAESLAWLKPANKRGEVLHFGNITLIDDCYNSNPKALNAMVDALAAMKANRRIVVAGEMLELGPASEEMHRECGRHMAERKIDILIGVRGMSRAMVDAASQSGVRAEFVSTPEDAGAWLVREARDGDVVLLKASRGVKLEKAIDVWKAAQSQPIA
jgi:UDP-N-acetylmuramoyl-tripeptide--D-alanyl-D-alanine ligase